LIFGAPAKVVREVTEENIERIRGDTMSYVERGAFYRQHLKRIG